MINQNRGKHEVWKVETTKVNQKHGNIGSSSSDVVVEDDVVVGEDGVDRERRCSEGRHR